MKTDYAKKSPTKRKRTSSKTQTRNGSSWLFIGLMLGLLVAAGVYLQQHGFLKQWMQSALHNPFIEAAAKPIQQKPSNAPAPPQFSFYTVLAKGGDIAAPSPEPEADTAKNIPSASPPTVNKVENTSKPATATDQSSQTAVTVAPPNLNNNPTAAINPPSSRKALAIKSTRYVLQIAALKNMNVADKMRAELTLLGFAVNITSVNANNQVWYRVVIGPYDSLKSAENVQLNLKKNNIHSLLRPLA